MGVCKGAGAAEVPGGVVFSLSRVSLTSCACLMALSHVLLARAARLPRLALRAGLGLVLVLVPAQRPQRHGAERLLVQALGPAFPRVLGLVRGCRRVDRNVGVAMGRALLAVRVVGRQQRCAVDEAEGCNRLDGVRLLARGSAVGRGAPVAGQHKGLEHRRRLVAAMFRGRRHQRHGRGSVDAAAVGVCGREGRRGAVVPSVADRKRGLAAMGCGGTWQQEAAGSGFLRVRCVCRRAQ
jgi:hypothetical protein